ncbi:PAS domain S-box protein [Streptomyces sp. AK02-01A]|uniref:PAS domain-containing sensor histidine kinase n=1 Tax=Streptomyces sp. AK02-01A TaxID=3028648 RepID=UPI0029B2FA22|nr:PAS domain S-box protein [Streptomyces sp. AK02-01A]MDX3849965.1 PAS domain S-box protein [Streptomyces sp. AK02-01A]
MTHKPQPRELARKQAAPLSEAAFTLLVQGVLDYGIFMLDPQGYVISWNAGAERIKGYSAAEIVGHHFSVFYPAEDKASGKPQWELETAVVEGRLEDEGWRIRNDGSRFWANVVITALWDDQGELRGFGKVTRDMTERRAAEHALSERRRLFDHLVRAQETERRRIAWDVHDDTIQAMVAVGMRLQLLAERVPESTSAELERLDASVRGAISRLRNLTFRLHPPGIDRHGLVEALSNHVSDVSDSWGMTSSFEHRLDREPTPETAITVFRIVQEALMNVHKHAHASTIALRVESSDGGILTRVIDNGSGEPMSRDAAHAHFGIIEMRERAETAGGWWSMRGEPGTGTTVEFWVPSSGPAPAPTDEPRRSR